MSPLAADIARYKYRNKQLKKQLGKTKSKLAKKESELANKDSELANKDSELANKVSRLANKVSELAACKREHKTVLDECKYKCFETAERLREAEQEIETLRAGRTRDFNMINCLTEIGSNFAARLVVYQNARPELN